MQVLALRRHSSKYFLKQNISQVMGSFSSRRACMAVLMVPQHFTIFVTRQVKANRSIQSSRSYIVNYYMVFENDSNNISDGEVL